MPVWQVYAIENTVTGTKYVGQTRKSLRRRLIWQFSQHPVISAEANVYGRAAFRITPLQRCSTLAEARKAVRAQRNRAP